MSLNESKSIQEDWNARLMELAAPPAAKPADKASKRKVLFKLDDVEVDHSLWGKYEYMTDMTPVVAMLAEATAYAGSFLATREFQRVNRLSSLPSIMETQTETSLVMEAIKAQLREHGMPRAFRISGEDFVEIEVQLPSLHTFLYGFQGRTAEENNMMDAMAANIALLLPGFKWPTSEADKGPKAHLHKLADLAKLRNKCQPITKISPPSNPEFKKLADMLGVRISLSEVVGIGDAAGAERLNTIQHTFRLDFQVVAVMRIPLEYAMWATMSETMEEFIPIQFWRLMSSRFLILSATKRVRNADKPPERYGNAFNVSTDRDTYIRDHGVKPIRKTNPDGFAITSKGGIVYIPEAQDPKVYGNLLKNAWDEKEGHIVDPEKQKEAANRPILTDWVTDKFYYTDASGQTHCVDLLGARPLDAVTVGRMLRGLSVGFTLERISGLMNEIGFASSEQTGYMKVLTTTAGTDSLLWDHIVGAEVFGDRDLDEASAHDRQITMMARRVGEDMARLYDARAHWLDKIPMKERISLWFYFVLVGEYGKNRSKFVDALAQSYTRNTARPEAVEPITYGMNGATGFLPHQMRIKAASTLVEMGGGYTGVIYDVPPGGGKSFIVIEEITRLIAEGKRQRPIVQMPGNLVKQWCNEATELTKGQLRTFPITLEVWKRWTNDLKLNWKQIEALITSQPKNTVFVTDYGFAKHDAEQIGFDRFDYTFFPKANFLSNLGFDYRVPDESQRLKNSQSLQTIASTSAFAMCAAQRLCSGTIIHKSVADKIGQMAQINPAALPDGTTETMFNGNKFLMSELGRLDANINCYARQIIVKRREWAYLLPTVREDVHFVELTDRQREFYAKIMEETVQEVLADKKLMAKMRSNDPDVQGAVEAAMKRYFAKVEVFINAPDAKVNSKSYGTLFSQLETTEDADLISPKVGAVDKLIDFHFNGGRHPLQKDNETVYRPDPAKVIVFSYNKQVSLHMMRHSRWSNRAVHFRAGDMEALEAFKNDPDVLVMFADENSIKEGHNLQMASRLIRLQTVWTPGDQEQALSRVLRPDVKNKYNRKFVNLDWISTQNTLEVAKQARMISRILEKAIIEETNASVTFRKMVDANDSLFNGLKPLSMNLDTLKDYSNSNDLEPYHHGYSLYKQWEDVEFQKERDKLQAEVSAKLGRPVSMEELPSLAMIPVINKPIPGAVVGGYHPWIKGYVPPDPHGLILRPMIDVEEAGDDDEDEEDAPKSKKGDDEDLPDGAVEDSDIDVTPGTVVMTEFGPGRIESFRRGSSIVRVVVPGLGKGAVTLPKASVFIIAHERKREAIEHLLKMAGNRGLATLRMKDGRPFSDHSGIKPEHLAAALKATEKSVKKVTPAPNNKPGRPAIEVVQKTATKTAPAAKPLPKDLPKPASKPIKQHLYQMAAGTMNNQLTMTVFAGGKADDVLHETGFHRIGRSMAATAQTWQGLENVLEMLRDKFVVPSDLQRNVEKMVALMKTAKGKMEKVAPPDLKFTRKFFVDNARKPTDRNEIHPYVIVDGGAVHIYVNQEVSTRARLLAKEPRLKFATRFNESDPYFIKFFRNKAELLRELERLQELGIVPEYPKDLAKDLKSLR